MSRGKISPVNLGDFLPDNYRATAKIPVNFQRTADRLISADAPALALAGGALGYTKKQALERLVNYALLYRVCLMEIPPKRCSAFTALTRNALKHLIRPKRVTR